MARNWQIKQLLEEVLTGRINRREALRRGAALGLSLPAMAALVGRADRAMARQTASPAAHSRRLFAGWQSASATSRAW